MMDGQTESVPVIPPRWANRLAAALAAAASLSLLATPAHAQGDDALVSEDEEEAPEGPLSEELEDYWTVDRDVDVVKNRLYQREGRFAVGLHLGLMSSEPFFWYLPAGGKLDYHFSNNWGVEIEGSYMDVPDILRHNTDLTDFAESEQGAGFDYKTDTLDQFKWRAHALAVWHPLYGKFSLLQRKLSHFDINLAAGFGAVSVNRPDENRQQSSEEILPEFVFGGGVQFYLNNHFVLRFTGRGYLYEGPRNFKNTETGQRVVSESVSNAESEDMEELNFVQRLELPVEFLLGVSYMF